MFFDILGYTKIMVHGSFNYFIRMACHTLLIAPLQGLNRVTPKIEDY